MNRESGRLRSDQTGFASIIVAIILVLVLSLITVGFAQLMRNEQRSSLDRQLSDQAYYAAESGVNDAAKAIQTAANAGKILTKSQCGPLAPGDPNYDPHLNSAAQTVDAASQTAYTCLLINPSPTSLEYSSVKDNQSEIFEFTPQDGGGNPVALDTIVISWQDGNGNTNFAPRNSYSSTGNSTLPSAANWPASSTGILRVSLTPFLSNNISRQALINDNYTAFLYPRDSGSTGNVGPVTAYRYADSEGTNGGAMLDGNCSTGNTPRYCSVEITGLAANGAANYLVNLRSIYNSSQRVTITGYPASGGSIPDIDPANRLHLSGAQTVVDSTGKSQDVLKRIQVRIPTRNSYEYPDFTMETQQSINKQIQVTPNCAQGAPYATVANQLTCQ